MTTTIVTTRTCDGPDCEALHQHPDSWVNISVPGPRFHGIPHSWDFCSWRCADRWTTERAKGSLVQGRSTGDGFTVYADYFDGISPTRSR